jgi:hypothetical protein
VAKGDKKGGKKKEETTLTPEEYMFELGFAMDLINSDPSLQEWIRRVRQYMDKNKGRTPTAYEMADIKQGIEWFERFNSDQELARMQQADPRLREDFNRSLELKRNYVKNLGLQYGITLSDQAISDIALAARLDQLGEDEIQARITPYLEQAIAASENLVGRAAEAERDIVQWSRANGLTLTGQSIARYVSSIARGEQTVDNVKEDLRRMYLAGAYPAWADRIDSGYDISDIAAPYKEKMAALLEIDDGSIDMNDSLLQMGLQGVGPDGRPSVVPLYEFERMVRNDPRWQKTDNAYKAYSEVADSVLSMFGFR